MYILNAPVSVDTFFVLSGFLVGYGYCLAMEKGVKFNIILFYLHRYLRLTPVLAVVVWFHTTIVEFLGSGPFWPMTMASLKKFCVENWWPPLLYIQNYYNTQDICLGQSWYLSVDMQLFILSPIILIPLWKWPKYTLLGSTVLVIGSIVSSFVVTYVKKLSAFTFVINLWSELLMATRIVCLVCLFFNNVTNVATFMLMMFTADISWPMKNQPVCITQRLINSVERFIRCKNEDNPGVKSKKSLQDSPDYMNNYYFTTHTRYGPWLMGLILGYYIFKLKKHKNHSIKLHPTQVTLAWIVSLALLCSTVFAGYDLTQHPSEVGNAFFNGLHRHGWALGVCWVIYACTQGYGGPVNSFLSWAPFQILSRFTYTIYLVHLSVQYVMLGAIRNNTHFSTFQAMYNFWGDFAVSLFLAICLTLAFESPMITIEKVLFKTGSKDNKKRAAI